MWSISRAFQRNINQSSTNQMEVFKFVYIRAQKLTYQIAKMIASYHVKTYQEDILYDSIPFTGIWDIFACWDC